MSKYIPSEEALRFIAFIRATGNEANISPEVHYRIADLLFSSDKKNWKLLIECLRGVGKSTIVEYAVIYSAALGYWPGFGKVPFIVFLGASQEGNVKQFFKNVANKVENSVFLKSVLTVKRQTDSEIELVNTDGIETIAAGKGMSTNWRGIRSKHGDRPTLLIADDILSNEVVTSETVRSTIETNWFSSALPALDPTRSKIIYIGTPLSEADLLHKLKHSGTYALARYPLCSKFPCSKEEFDSAWPDRFTYEYALSMYRDYEAVAKTQEFYTEYMLELTDLSSLLVEDEDIKRFDPSSVIMRLKDYNIYISTDFATSTRKSADFSTIAVWAINSKNDWMLIDGQCKRQTMQENIDDLFRLVAKYNPLSVGIESSGQQGGFLSIIEDLMIQRNIWFAFAKKPGSKEVGIRPVKDKMHRFVTGVQPRFKQGKIWLPKHEYCKRNPALYEAVVELDNELSKLTFKGGFGKLQHDDMIDTLNQLSEMETFAPSEESSSYGETLYSDKSEGVWAVPYSDDDEYKRSSSQIF